MDLPGLDEPVGLRVRAATDPDAVRAQIASGRLIVAPVWKAWGPTLAARGVDRAALSAVLRGSSYELWLWAAGERTWAQFLEGLAGRVGRRAEAGAAKGRAPGRAAKASRAGKPTKSPARAGSSRGQGRPASAAKATKAKATKAKATKAGKKATPTKAAKKTRRR